MHGAMHLDVNISENSPEHQLRRHDRTNKPAQQPTITLATETGQGPLHDDANACPRNPSPRKETILSLTKGG
ncbi:hypothetical protein BDV32DRAFT_127570 [Aspergillus pseudonomiae]|nr:hypothetical protein BDV32DRAFT_127570 [Aspergillus pseudonomiae]